MSLNILTRKALPALWGLAFLLVAGPLPAPVQAQLPAVITWEGPVDDIRGGEIIVDDELFALSPSVVVYDRKGKRRSLRDLRRGMKVQLVYRGSGQPVVVINIR